MIRERSYEQTARAVGGSELLHGRYRLAERLGSGGFADVFRADDEVLGRPVAVKVFRFDAGARDERRIDAEVRTLAALDHPGLVTIFDAGVDGSGDRYGSEVPVPFLVMELVSGPSLAVRLSAGALRSGETAIIGRQVADTLAYVHGQGVVHRDIKPANVLLEQQDPQSSPVVKLTDFGIARLVGSPRITLHDTAVGTPNYLSPEQVEGVPAGPASDIYALGLVLLECLTGQLSYPGTGIEAALGRLHRQPAIPDHLGPQWVGLLRAMTDRDPGARPDAGQVAGALAQFAEPATGLTLPSLPLDGPRDKTSPVQTMRLPARERRRRIGVRGLLIGFAAIVAAGIAAVVVLLPRTHDAPTPAPVPTSYPSVDGQLGVDLNQLERVIP